MRTQKEILCIHYYFPPIRSGGVLRNYFFACEFSKNFDHVHVITTSNVDIMEQEELPLPQNMTIYKADTHDFRSIRSKGNHISMQSKKSLLFKSLARLKKTLPFHFYIDEGGQKYIRSSVSIAEKILGENPITHLYSSFMPYADHKISSILKRKFSQLKWIADFRDLQNEPIYKNIYFPAWNEKQEIKILQNADRVTTISDGLAGHLRKIHPNVKSVPRGINYSPKPGSKSDRFTIAYTGSLFFDFRDGSIFTSALRSWINENQIIPDQFQFVYAGRDGKKWYDWMKEEGIELYFIDKGFISRKEALEIQSEAHALLLLSSSSTNHQGVLTGKLFEYLERNTPIINIINGVVDEEFEKLFNQTEAGKVFYPGDERRIQEYIHKLYTNFTNDVPPAISEAAQKSRSLMNWAQRTKELLSE